MSLSLRCLCLSSIERISLAYRTIGSFGLRFKGLFLNRQFHIQWTVSPIWTSEKSLNMTNPSQCCSEYIRRSVCLSNRNGRQGRRPIRTPQDNTQKKPSDRLPRRHFSSHSPGPQSAARSPPRSIGPLLTPSSRSSSPDSHRMSIARPIRKFTMPLLSRLFRFAPWRISNPGHAPHLRGKLSQSMLS
jgi:hypothetical protein